MPCCAGCKNLTLDQIRCDKCKKFCCKKCQRLKSNEGSDAVENVCPDCFDNTDSLSEPTTEEIEPAKVLKRVTSLHWEDKVFMKKDGEIDMKRVYCKECLEKGVNLEGIAYSGNTTNLKEHDRVYHECKTKSSSVGIQSGSRGIPGFSTTNAGPKWQKKDILWKETTKLLTEWLIQDSRPTNLVQDEGFAKLMRFICPQYEIPCRTTTITTNIEKMYNDKKEEFRKELDEVENVAVSSDKGSSINGLSFQTEIVHFITDDLELKSRNMAIRENKEESNAENYRIRTDEVMEDLGIERKVCQFVTDNEPKMNASFPNDRSGCVAHILNKTVEKGMLNPTAARVVKKFRGITGLHNKSPKVRYTLEKKQKDKDLGLKTKTLKPDVATRWGSTKTSIAACLPGKDEEDHDLYFEAINNALAELAAKSKKKEQRKKMMELKLTREDISRLRAIHDLLVNFDVASTVLCMNKFPSCSLTLPVLETVKNEALKPDSESEHEFIEDMKVEMLEDIGNRVSENVNVEVMRKGSALDPRTKGLKFMKNKLARKVVQDRILEELRQIPAAGENNNLVEGESSDSDDVEEPVAKKGKKFGINMFSYSDDEESEVSEDKVSLEWSNYLAEPVCGFEKDPLEWFRERRVKYPTVVKLMRKYLCIPATSVDAERAFSALGVLLTKKRLAMTSEHVEMQLFLKDKM